MGRITGDELREKQDAGFSIVEVLVVVVIISLLASISIPIFFNQREKAWQASTEAALKNTSTAMTSASIAQGGSYVGLTIPQLVANEGLKYNAADITLVVASSNQGNFCLSATHRSWNQTMFWDSAEARPNFTDCTAKY